MDRLVIEGCAVATVDGTAGDVLTAGAGTEYESARAAARALAGRHRVRP